MGEDAVIVNMLGAGIAHCRVVAAEDGGLLASLFLAGLLGSATHCVGMCGPFVLSQTMARLEAVPAARMREFDRLRGAALVPYHLGRTTTYVMLGAVVSAAAGGVIEVWGLGWLSAALMVLAAVFFAGYALQRLRLMPQPRLPGAGPARRGSTWWDQTVGRRVRPLFARPVGWRGYALGIALGFLPCGLLYGALAAAAAGGGALTGALSMTAFALGTVPALVATGFAGHVAGAHWRIATARAVPVLMLANAAALSYFAWRTVA